MEIREYVTEENPQRNELKSVAVGGERKTVSYRKEMAPVRFQPEKLSGRHDRFHYRGLREGGDYPFLAGRHDLWTLVPRRVWFTYALSSDQPAMSRALAWYIGVRMAEPEDIWKMAHTDEKGGEEASELSHAYFPRDAFPEHYDRPQYEPVPLRMYPHWPPITVTFDTPATPAQKVQEAFANAGAVILFYPDVTGEALWRLIRLDAEESAGIGRSARRHAKDFTPFSRYSPFPPTNRPGDTFPRVSDLWRGTSTLSEGTQRDYRAPEDWAMRDTLGEYEVRLDAEHAAFDSRLTVTDRDILQWHRSVLRQMVRQEHPEIPSQKDNIRKELGWRLDAKGRQRKAHLLEKLGNEFPLTRSLLVRMVGVLTERSTSCPL